MASIRRALWCVDFSPIGTGTDKSRRTKALANRYLSRPSRGGLPYYWNKTMFGLGARVHCIPEATIQQRGHRIRHLNRRHWIVRSNRIKRMVVGSEAWRLEGH